MALSNRGGIENKDRLYCRSRKWACRSPQQAGLPMTRELRAKRAIEKLQAADILKQVNQASDRVYCAVPLLKILEESARLVPVDVA